MKDVPILNNREDGSKAVLLWRQRTPGSWVLLIFLSPSLSSSIVVIIDKHAHIIVMILW
jgi:hypothetical protein